MPASWWRRPTRTENSPAAWPAATFRALSSKNAVVAAFAPAASSAILKACVKFMTWAEGQISHWESCNFGAALLCYMIAIM